MCVSGHRLQGRGRARRGAARRVGAGDGALRRVPVEGLKLKRREGGVHLPPESTINGTGRGGPLKMGPCCSPDPRWPGGAGSQAVLAGLAGPAARYQ